MLFHCESILLFKHKPLQEYVGHALQWVVCLLHSNELPLRKLFLTIDGTTTGPNSYGGPLGKLFVQKGYLNQLPIVNFLPIECSPLPELDRGVLSKDQQHLYDLCTAIITGHVPTSLAQRVIGNVHHARFLNLATSILRYYVSTANPSVKLRALAKYVMKVYAPVFFAVKLRSKIYDGAKHLFDMFKGIKSMSRPHYELLLPVVLNNSYFWHPENLLLGKFIKLLLNKYNCAFYFQFYRNRRGFDLISKAFYEKCRL